jgi:hypothetical protein
MSISGILSSAFSQTQPTNVATPAQKFFSQLASELQSGSSSSAQNDLSTLQQAVEGQSSSSSASSPGLSSTHANSMHSPHGGHRLRAERFESTSANMLDELDPAAQSLTSSNILQALSSTSTSSGSLFGSPSSIAGSYQVVPPISTAAVSLLA